MKKTLIAIISLVIVTLGATLVFAHGGGFENNLRFQNQQNKTGIYHEQVEELIETGTYQDLENLREEVGFPIARWVNSEEDFAEFKERHEEMEKEGYTNYGSNRGYGKGGMHGRGDCGFR
ncbi:MAG: hypothetical protein KC589_05955 [Nanoarchaeota archaeon]|nr:hypothetical protein [Nanoarchaeota archaeon]